LGVDIKTLTVGIGLTGFAIGLALKDFFANIVSGIMILFYSPFELGDTIIVNKIEGKVTNLNLRFVTIEKDNEINLIPNSWFLSYNVTILRP
jgi:small-conductance mechanosensitive channel